MRNNPFRLGAQAAPDMSGAIAALTDRAKGFGAQMTQPIRTGAANTSGDSHPLATNQTDAFGADSGLSTERIAQLRAMGFNDNVPLQLIGSESGGNWAAQNNEEGSSGKRGHYGLMQFGHDRLLDAKNAGIIPADMTPQQFMADERAQVSTINWHFNDIDSRIYRDGLNRFVGSTVGGVPMSMMGMRSQAHLGGFKGMRRFALSDGQYNPSDSYGTSLKKYGHING